MSMALCLCLYELFIGGGGGRFLYVTFRRLFLEGGGLFLEFYGTENNSINERNRPYIETHQYRGGHGFKSCCSLECFLQAKKCNCLNCLCTARIISFISSFIYVFRTHIHYVRALHSYLAWGNLMAKYIIE